MRNKLLIVLLAIMATGCAGTRDAYKAAEGVEETAKVMSEHYLAILTELNVMKANGDLAGAALERAQSVVRVAAPALDEVRLASDNYAAARSAQTEAELTAALSRAAIQLSRLIDIIKPARRQVTSAPILFPALATN
jgi:hypothetical protein